MKVRIQVVEFNNGHKEFYVQIKNSFFSSWMTLKADGRSARRLSAKRINEGLRSLSFGTLEFAEQHAIAVVQQELEEKGLQVKRVSYIDRPGC